MSNCLIRGVLNINPMDKIELINYANQQLIHLGNLAVISEVFTIDYIAYADGKEYKGHTFIKRFAKQLRDAFPDLRVVKVEILTSDEEKITWQRVLAGTNTGGLMGIPASGKKVTWTEMVVSRLATNKIAEEWIVSELLGKMLLQLPKR